MNVSEMLQQWKEMTKADDSTFVQGYWQFISDDEVKFEYKRKPLNGKNRRRF